ncbi:hypothetical protein JKP88DRAFT_208693 [Tribonema minus]|uniref:tRNA-binding domain-containing protein n=1 Tax=Tribonema minus TaxID=303371 RepID=A0A835YVV0_9STRA|nr:hypothetical protein JKP88DRAFT_208693 [Tribonema minus]
MRSPPPPPPPPCPPVWHHPDSEKLFCEEIECGDGGDGQGAPPRPVASGLRAHHTLAEMDQRLVCVVCNLKPAKLAGFESNGMVLAASGGGKVELIRPPAGSVVGERLFVEGLTGAPLNPNQVKKKKAWEALAPSLLVDAEGRACFGDAPIRTAAGVCAADTVRSGTIS